MYRRGILLQQIAWNDRKIYRCWWDKVFNFNSTDNEISFNIRMYLILDHKKCANFGFYKTFKNEVLIKQIVAKLSIISRVF